MSTRRKNEKVSAFQGERPKDIIAANNVKANGTESKPQSKGDRGVGIFQVVPALFDFYAALSMVFGGCCSNMIAYEQLLLINPHIGSALTFSQILFITLQSLPSFLVFPKSGLLPRLKPRQVPLKQWAIQVMVLTSGSLLNNWAYAYNVPLTIFIVFRSASLPVSMILGYLVLKKRYSILQLFSISIVTVGVILVTLSRTASSSDSSSANISTKDLGQYSVGISMLVVSLLCTGVLGVLQEKTYTKYGPCWKEGVFYTHVLSLPFFVPSPYIRLQYCWVTSCRN
ncbi:hypothetical protein D9613_006015 [Agrocybe pediades]|uniref:UAA transporter n=1 Tax=Agrocybe pediades TaxID=84607 RepID=A0A8H4VPN3_9AGAR|nr:hypothetical protein D9613_006015 [Agrocybe pediades]